MESGGYDRAYKTKDIVPLSQNPSVAYSLEVQVGSHEPPPYSQLTVQGLVCRGTVQVRAAALSP